MKFILLFIIAIGLLKCTSKKNDEYTIDSAKPCEFTNPVGPGQDPWVIRHSDKYLFLEHSKRGIYLSENKHLTDIKTDRKRIWTLPEYGWNSQNLWAPELHRINNQWFIYYSGGSSGPPFTKQRSGVLRAVSDDPFGEWKDMGMLYTGDEINTGENEKWAIDLTVLKFNDNLYAIWSGWEENRDTDRTPQHIYIAEMENPWTIKTNRVKISSPQKDWENGTELAINEGPQILKNKDDDVFIIYSASESWLPAYNLGQLKLIDPKNPMSPDSWNKSGPVFKGTSKVYGVGHASFTTSPDETEDWIIYHTKINDEPGWDRVIHMQPFDWNVNNSPNFGEPVPAGISLDRPSGEC